MEVSMNFPYGLTRIEDCASCSLRSGNFFCALSRETLEALDCIKHQVVFPRSAVICLEGQAPANIFILCQGKAKLSTTSTTGKTLVLGMVEPGDVVGMAAATTYRPYQWTAETSRPCQLSLVNRDDFLQFLKKHADACLQAVRHLSGDCQTVYGVAGTMGLCHSSSKRLVKFLLETASHGEVVDGVTRVRFTLTHSEISQRIGTNRVTISRNLSVLRKRGMAELKDSKLFIRNQPAMQQLLAAQ
jgi:CRP/FNR family transcriptional regulator, cyclic AMP receptor protein